MKTSPLRFILSLVLGAFVAYCVTIFLLSYAPLIFSYSGLSGPMSREAQISYINELPLRAAIAIILSTMLGAFAGGYTAARISTIRKGDAAIGVGIFSLIILVFMSIAFDFPWIIGIGISIVQIPFAMIGGRIAKVKP